jgi:hypothetical protein
MITKNVLCVIDNFDIHFEYYTNKYDKSYTRQGARLLGMLRTWSTVLQYSLSI